MRVIGKLGWNSCVIRQLRGHAGAVGKLRGHFRIASEFREHSGVVRGLRGRAGAPRQLLEPPAHVVHVARQLAGTPSAGPVVLLVRRRLCL